MPVENFHIGDTVIYKDPLGEKAEYRGKIISKQQYTYVILFEDAFARRYSIGPVYAYFSDEHLLPDSPSLTTEQKVQQKCILLWNKSKYVQKTPTNRIKV